MTSEGRWEHLGTRQVSWPVGEPAGGWGAKAVPRVAVEIARFKPLGRGRSGSCPRPRLHRVNDLDLSGGHGYSPSEAGLGALGHNTPRKDNAKLATWAECQMTMRRAARHPKVWSER